MKYVIGNGRDFLFWKERNPFRNAMLAVRHIPNVKHAMGLLAPKEPYEVVVLHSADPSAVRYMRQRGFKV